MRRLSTLKLRPDHRRRFNRTTMFETHAAGILSPGDQVEVHAGDEAADFLLLAARPLQEPIIKWENLYSELLGQYPRFVFMSMVGGILASRMANGRTLNFLPLEF